MDPTLVSAALVIVMGATVLLHRIPGPCQCEKCGFHVNERRMEAERKRVKSHRHLHVWLDIPWGDEKCPGCRAGNEGDRLDS